MRKRVYFVRDVGREDDDGNWIGYRAGHWYDGVPDDHFTRAIAAGAALEVEEAPRCGCLLVSGRAIVVRLVHVMTPGGVSMGYCPVHVGDAHAVPEPIDRRKKQREAIDRAFDEGIASGKIAVDP